MSCPGCHAPGRQQIWHCGFSATATDPEELPHFECLACGYEYGGEEEMRRAQEDHAYDDIRIHR